MLVFVCKNINKILAFGFFSVKIRSMTKKLPELLAPAGDRTRLAAALQYGADAVYLAGKRFGMRSAPDNFDYDQLNRMVDAFLAAGGSRSRSEGRSSGLEYRIMVCTVLPVGSASRRKT